MGDYKGNYKYQTAINKECWQAFAQSYLLVDMVSKTVKECIKVWIQDREAPSSSEDVEKSFKQELFPQQTMNMGLKLLIIICQNMDNSTQMLSLVQSVLPAELLNQAFNIDGCKDGKLSEIGLYLKGLIFKEEKVEESKGDQT